VHNRCGSYARFQRLKCAIWLGVFNKEVINERIEKMISLLGLQEFRNYYPHQLSVSSEQRIIIGRAFAMNPDLLLMDEPYGQMDIKSRFYLEDEVIRLWKELGSTVVFITHNIEEAVYLAERILILAMSLMPLVLPMRLCSAISAVTVVAIGLQMVVMLRKNLNWREVFVPVLCCMLTTNLGVYILMHYPEKVLRSILAVFILLLTVYFIISRKHKLMIKKSLKNDILFGLVTGISTGMFNIVGPFFMIYYFSICEENLNFKANIEFSFLAAGLYSTVLHFLYGNMTLEVAPFIMSSAAAAVIAGFVGLRLFRRLNREMICKVIYIAMPVMALFLLK